jgi:soluble lytic murein transglycosylase
MMSSMQNVRVTLDRVRSSLSRGWSTLDGLWDKAGALGVRRKAVTLGLLAASAAAVGATLAPNAAIRVTPPVQTAQYQPQYQQPPRYQAPPRPAAPMMATPRISSALARWNSLRQSDNHPFSSYASFLASYRGWPGETGMR